MSLAEEQFDGAAQELLRDFEAAPAEGSWALISARLPERRKRRVAAWWWALGMAMAFGLGVAGFYSLREGRNGVFATTTHWAGNPLGSKSDEKGHGALTAPRSEVTEAAFDSLRERRSSVANGELIKGHKTSETLSENAGVTVSRAAGAAVSGHNNKTTVANSITDAPPSRAASATYWERGVTREPLGGSDQSDPDAEQPVPLSNTSSPNSLLQDTEVSTINASVASQIYTKIHLPPLTAVVSDAAFALGPDIPCPTFGKGKQWLLAVRANVGPGIVSRSIDAPSSELRNYAQLRDSVEQRQLQPRAGLYLEAVHTSGLFVRAGLDYRMYRSNIMARGPETQTTTLVEVRDPISGNLIRTDTSVTIATSTTTVYNRIQTLTPVIGLGYRHTFGRVTPYVLAQAGYELTLKGRGTVPDPLGQPVDLNQVDGYVARQPGSQFGGAVGFDVSLSKQWAIGLSVEYLRLGSTRGPADPIEYTQRVVTPGLNVVYRF